MKATEDGLDAPASETLAGDGDGLDERGTPSPAPEFRPAGRLERAVRAVEGVLYWLVVAPLLSWLPARWAYAVACWRGDWDYRYRSDKRRRVMGNLQAVMREDMTGDQRTAAARDYFRQLSCEAIDIMLLRGSGRRLSRLVEIRGLENVQAALAAGKGAILCSAHMGTYNACFSLVNMHGFPVTTIGRWQHNYTAHLSLNERRFWRFVYQRRVMRHRHRPNIEPWPGNLRTALEAADALRANEVVTICVDAPPLPSERERTVPVELFGRTVRLLPGVVTLAELTGAAVLPTFLYRSPDCHHQTLEISPPVSMEGDAVTAFGHCIGHLEAAIRRQPAAWVYWASPDDLINIGLLGDGQRETAGRLP